MVAFAAKSHDALRRVAVSSWALTLGAAGVGGIVLRIWVYRSPLGTPDGDEGVVGLVGRHILDGQFPAFIWGLFYGGIQELLLTAPIFWIFGSSWIALRIVPIFITAVTALLVWRVGRRTIGEPAATVAGVLFWIWPPYDLYQLIHQHGYYASDAFYCTLYMLLALRVAERPSTARVGVFGLVLGLGFWQTSHSVPIIVGAVAWTIWRQPAALRKLWAALPLAVLGALPWIIWNVKHDWASLHISYDAASTYWHRLRIFVSPLLPMIVGIRHIGTQARVLPEAMTLLLELILAALFAYGAWRSIRRDRSILYVVAVVFPFIYAISGFTIESSDPRYLVVLTPVLALLFAQLAGTRVRGMLLLALGAGVSYVILHTAIVQAPPQIDPPRDFRPLISTLDRFGVHYIYSSHWIAYRLAFETNERIIGVKNDWSHGIHWTGNQATPGPDTYIRYPPWERAVAEHRHAFVFERGKLPPFLPELRHLGYRSVDVGALIVYVLR